MDRKRVTNLFKERNKGEATKFDPHAKTVVVEREDLKQMASLAFRPHIRNGNEEFLDRVIDNYVYAENLIEEIEMAEEDDFSAEDSGSI